MEKVTHITLGKNQGTITVTEDPGRIYSKFTVDTFGSNYNFTQKTIDRILAVFNEQVRHAKRGCYFSASQTYVCSPGFPFAVYQSVFDDIMRLVKDPSSYYLIPGG